MRESRWQNLTNEFSTGLLPRYTLDTCYMCNMLQKLKLAAVRLLRLLTLRLSRALGSASLGPVNGEPHRLTARRERQIRGS